MDTPRDINNRGPSGASICLGIENRPDSSFFVNSDSDCQDDVVVNVHKDQTGYYTSTNYWPAPQPLVTQKNDQNIDVSASDLHRTSLQGTHVQETGPNSDLGPRRQRMRLKKSKLRQAKTGSGSDGGSTGSASQVGTKKRPKGDDSDDDGLPRMRTKKTGKTSGSDGGSACAGSEPTQKLGKKNEVHPNHPKSTSHVAHINGTNATVSTESAARESTLCYSKNSSVINLWRIATQRDSNKAVVCINKRDFPIVKLLHKIPVKWDSTHPQCSVGVQIDEQRDASTPTVLRSVPPPLAFDTDEPTKLLHASDYAKIIQLLERLPKNLPSHSLVASQFIGGVAYFKMSQFKFAKVKFKTCEAEARKANRDGDVMLCNAYLGDIAYASKLYLAAADHYKKAIQSYTQVSVASLFKLTPPTLSAIHAKCASSFRNESKMVEAVREYRTAIKEAQSDRDLLSSHTSLGNLYQSMGDNTSALAEYKKSIQLAERLSDHVSLGWAYGNIGNAYLGLNKKDEAIYHLKKSLDLAVKYETTPQAIGRTYNNLGTAYQSMNDLDRAEEYYDLALNQAVYGNDIAGQARVYGNIGNVYMLRKNYERAIPYYGEVLQLSTDASTVSTARHNRGCAYYEWATFEQNSADSCSVQSDTVKFHNHECDKDVCLQNMSPKATELYRKGRDDLVEVVKYHEEKFSHIKGSSNGLTLSVSLFESNSRTFHRLQDCLVSLHEWERALVIAEQSRARTLGELMLKRKENKLKYPLTSPLTFEQATSIIENQQCPLVYLSYTGARLLGWVFIPDSGKATMSTFEVPLRDDQFEGKSFDYYLRYILTEKLVERSFEMYQSITYDETSSSSVQILHDLVAVPIMKLLGQHSHPESCFREIILVSDSYTSLLPLTCLFDSETNSFFGDYHYLRSVPSLLSWGVMQQISEVTVTIPDDQHDLCIVGDPDIPPFHYNGEIWTLGKLPHARREAEWVAHTLGTTPVLNEMATKSALLTRLMRAKVVHIATHGSASAGFLAFAAFGSVRIDGSVYHITGENVLLFPEDIEKQAISPALVVLSSCDSGRGTVKADGIQGMARAFILAGAQSVLTTLWKVPDESASVFMQFFYQYLTDGLLSSLALQKSILSVRCFAKYSQYIHWSGYQLTGQDIHFLNKNSHTMDILKKQFGSPSVFSRLANLKMLKKSLVNNPNLPTDFQIMQGSPGVQPSEVVFDFILSHHQKFTGGIFWINCGQEELLQASIDYIEKKMGKDLLHLQLSENQQALLVLDHIINLPNSESLLRIMKHRHVHVISLSNNRTSVDKLIKEVDQKLIRGCKIYKIEPLSVIHSTQRLVYHVMSSREYVPTNGDQQTFEHLAEFTVGSPVIIEIVSNLLFHNFQIQCDALDNLVKSLSLDVKPLPKAHYEAADLPTRCISENVHRYISTVTIPPECRDVWETLSSYDSWDSILQLLDACELSCEERLLLNCLSLFTYSPVPLSLISELASTIAITIQKPQLAVKLHHKLVKYKLIKTYPLPVVLPPHNSPELEPEFFYVPQLISSCIWKNLKKIDQIAVLSLMHHTLKTMCSANSLWLQSICLEASECSFNLISKDCYQKFFGLYLHMKQD